MKIARAAFLALSTFCLASFGQEPRLTPHVNTQHPILAIGSPGARFFAARHRRQDP